MTPGFWIGLVDITPHNRKSMLKHRTQTPSTQEKIHTQLCHFIMFAWALAWHGCGSEGPCALGIQCSGAESLMKQSMHKVTSSEALSFGYR